MDDDDSDGSPVSWDFVSSTPAPLEFEASSRVGSDEKPEEDVVHRCEEENPFDSIRVHLHERLMEVCRGCIEAVLLSARDMQRAQQRVAASSISYAIASRRVSSSSDTGLYSPRSQSQPEAEDDLNSSSSSSSSSWTSSSSSSSSSLRIEMERFRERLHRKDDSDEDVSDWRGKSRSRGKMDRKKNEVGLEDEVAQRLTTTPLSPRMRITNCVEQPSDLEATSGTPGRAEGTLPPGVDEQTVSDIEEMFEEMRRRVEFAADHVSKRWSKSFEMMQREKEELQDRVSKLSEKVKHKDMLLERERAHSSSLFHSTVRQKEDWKSQRSEFIKEIVKLKRALLGADFDVNSLMQNFESADETSQDEPSKEESEQPRVPTFSLEDVEKEKLKVQQAMQSQINALERELRESKSKLLVSGGLQSEYEKIMADYDSLSIQLADSNLRAEALSNEVDTLKARLSTVIDEYSLQITTLETEKMTLAEEMDLVNTKISSSTKSTEEVDMRNPVHIVTFPDLDSPPRHSVIPDQSSNRKIDSVSVSIQVDPVFVPTLNNSSISSSPPSNFESERDNYLSKIADLERRLQESETEMSRLRNQGFHSSRNKLNDEGVLDNSLSNDDKTTEFGMKRDIDKKLKRRNSRSSLSVDEMFAEIETEMEEVNLSPEQSHWSETLDYSDEEKLKNMISRLNVFQRLEVRAMLLVDKIHDKMSSLFDKRQLEMQATLHSTGRIPSVDLRKSILQNLETTLGGRRVKESPRLPDAQQMVGPTPSPRQKLDRSQSMVQLARQNLSFASVSSPADSFSRARTFRRMEPLSSYPRISPHDDARIRPLAGETESYETRVRFENTLNDVDSQRVGVFPGTLDDVGVIDPSIRRDHWMPRHSSFSSSPSSSFDLDVQLARSPRERLKASERKPGLVLRESESPLSSSPRSLPPSNVPQVDVGYLSPIDRWSSTDEVSSLQLKDGAMESPKPPDKTRNSVLGSSNSRHKPSNSPRAPRKKEEKTSSLPSLLEKSHSHRPTKT